MKNFIERGENPNPIKTMVRGLFFFPKFLFLELKIYYKESILSCEMQQNGLWKRGEYRPESDNSEMEYSTSE